MSPQRSSNWNIATFVTVVLFGIPIVFYAGGAKKTLDKLDAAYTAAEQARADKDAMQDGRLGLIENRATALEANQRNLKAEQDRLQQEMNRGPIFNEWASVKRLRAK